MPSFREHLKRSMKRNGKAFTQLNEWLDGDQVAPSQRLLRHLQFKKSSRYVRDQWGEKGLKEYRNHLSDDFRFLITTIWTLLWRRFTKHATRTHGRR